MRVIDISKELFSVPSYPGDPVPSKDIVRRISAGDPCNLSGFYTGCHQATHVDAPLHFVEDGKSIDQMDLSAFMGRCTVVEAEGIITGADIDRILPNCEKMILFKGNGNAFFSESAAFAVSEAGIRLVGTDAQSIEDGDDTFPAHRQLLGEEVVILEGINLSQVEPGNYDLMALPLYLGGAEASPVRAVLFTDD